MKEFNDKIKEISEIIYQNNYDSRVCARALLSKGIGNINDFAKGFIDHLQKGLSDENPMKSDDKVIIAIIKMNFESYLENYLKEV